VRLAARLTGWDVDILTPPEFQNGTQRLDATLKQIEGITQEHVDKVIALGLIDVRDIEEVGAGPLMEELGLDEETATKVVDRCADEAKVVQQEQDAKKAAEAAQRSAAASAFASASAGGPFNPTGDPLSRGVDATAFANPLLQQAPLSEDSVTEVPEGSPGTLVGAMEATEGLAPEITTHKESTLGGDGAELSPEEQAVQAPGGGTLAATEPDRKEIADEDDDATALAEGRVDPPLAGRDEPEV
jgi:N utilization substance protein A